MSQSQRKLMIILFALLVLTFPVKFLLLSRAKVISLKTDPLSYPVEKALQPSEASYRPLEGKDYTISPEKFFGDSNWVAVTVQPLANSLNTESMVFEKKADTYKLVYGPSNFFQGSNFESLPSDIRDYLVGKE